MALIPCPECGNPISTGARECPACGHPTALVPSLPPNALPYMRPSASRPDSLASGTATAGMICGIGGLLLLFVPCGWLLAILPSGLGIVLSSVAFGKIRRLEEKGWGMAVAGLICGSIGLLLYGLLWLILQDALHQFVSEDG